MNDTSREVRELHRRLLMDRSGEERFHMAVSMCQTARAVVWASLPDNLSDAERRVQFMLRFYGRDIDSETRERITARILGG